MDPPIDPYAPPAEWVDPQSVNNRRRWAGIFGIGVLLVVGFSWLLDKAAEPAAPTPAPTSMQLIGDVAKLVDEVRGMGSLHLMLDEGRERRAVEARLRIQRGRVSGLMTTAAASMPLADDQRQLHELTSALNDYWQVQDQMLALSRMSNQDRDMASKARAMLTGQSTRSYQALLATTERWFASHERP